MGKARQTAVRIGAAAAVALLGAMAPAHAADRALLIGIDSYADGQLSTGGASARADTEAMVGALAGPLGYPLDGLRVLLDGEATRDAILVSFREWLIAGTSAGDRVFFYFSGQGYFAKDTNGDEADGLDETLLPHDARVETGPAVGNVISDDEIRELAASLDGRSVTIVVDAGHAGVVTASASSAAPTKTRAVSLGTRAIVVEPRVQAQKSEGAPLDTEGLGSNVAVYSATSGGQAPVVGDKGSAFTQGYVEAVSSKASDANGNGTLSNAEILAYIRQKSEGACNDEYGCDVGLTPTLGPATAAGASPYIGTGPQTVSADVVLDYFAAGHDGKVKITQTPVSPVKTGTRDIRFQVTSNVAGNLILLDVNDKGRLVQLFPNKFVIDTGREGVVRAGSPITVPDDYYGISFDATEPASGTLIALVTHEKIEFPVAVKTRGLEVIPREDVVEDYLPAIAEVLTAPVATNSSEPTRFLKGSVATLRYEITP